MAYPKFQSYVRHCIPPQESLSVELTSVCRCQARCDSSFPLVRFFSKFAPITSVYLPHLFIPNNMHSYSCVCRPSPSISLYIYTTTTSLRPCEYLVVHISSHMSTFHSYTATCIWCHGDIYI